MAVLLRGRFYKKFLKLGEFFELSTGPTRTRKWCRLMLNATHMDVDTLSENVPNVYRNLLGRRPELIGPHLQLTVIDASAPASHHCHRPNML